MTEEQRINKAISSLESNITGRADLLGDRKPSILFYPMVRLLAHLLSCDPDRMISKTSIKFRKLLHPVLLLLLPLFLEYRQVFESKNALLGIDEPDEPIDFPKDSVIWCPNHGFKDDIATSIGATRHSYVLFGSLPAFFNTLDGVGAYVNGVVLCNRKVKKSRRASVDAAGMALDMGMDLTIFPEGVWNKTPEKLILDLWPGAYRLAKEKGKMIIPVIHYLADPHKKYDGNVIHTVVADPISMEGLNEKEGLALLRDTMATWYYLLMEKYGTSTRSELLEGFDSADAAWDEYLAIHTGAVDYYDREIELCADFRPKDVTRPEDVWRSVADIKNIRTENIAHIKYARELLAQEQRRNFQRKF